MPSNDMLRFAEIVGKMKENRISFKSGLFQKDLRDIKRSVKYAQTSSRTYLIVMAVNVLTDDRNKVGRIGSCKGMSIGGNAYDTVDDCYVIRCEDYLGLGYVDVSFEITMRGTEDWWSVVMPIPESVMKRHMSSEQMMDLARFKLSYAAPTYRIEYLQMVS